MTLHTVARFSDVLGQDPAVRLLQGLLQARRIPPALIFAGPVSCGKELCARAFAFAASCTTGVGCGACDPCRANAFGEGFRVLNVHDIFADEKIRNKVDVLREFLAEQNSAHSFRHRIVFLDRADRLNESMQGSLLKQLEEPAPGVCFILAVESLDTLRPTIRSRAALVRFRPLADDALVAILGRIGVVPAAGRAIDPQLLKAAGGSVERARLLAQTYESADRLIEENLLKSPPRKTTRLEVQERLAVAIPAAAALRPEWRDALLELDAAVRSNASMPLSFAVFRAKVEHQGGGARGREGSRERLRK